MSGSSQGPPNTNSSGSDKPAPPRPSIRLTLSTAASSAAAAAASNNNNTNAPPPPPPATTSHPPPPPPTAKRRKYTPPVALNPDTASVTELTVLHQQTVLQFILDQSPVGAASPTWHAQGHVTLYVIRDNDDDNESAGTGASAAAIRSNSSNSSSSTMAMALALHLRSTCVATKVQVATVNESATAIDNNLRTSYHHADPLTFVLLKPAACYSVSDGNGVDDDDNVYDNHRCHADTQSSRGAVGMTTALRAASIASNMGELRISCQRPSNGTVSKNDESKIHGVRQAWKRDILGDNKGRGGGNMVRTLQEQLRERSSDRRDARLELVAQRLAAAGSAALKITVSYNIPLNGCSSGGIYHLAGLHVLSQYPNPHVYTTAGVYGDHEGPRCWMPCCDSASVEHRSTHELTVQVTAPMSMGLSVAGAGEDLGCARALLLHKADWNRQQRQAAMELGQDYADMLERVWTMTSQHEVVGQHENLHVIPTENSVESLALIQATVAWTSASWSPVPARSMGFAIGPFKTIGDPEYFGIESFADADANAADDDEDDDVEGLTLEQKHRAFVEAARRNGEGIRQVYFAPLYERKFIHQYADRKLLPKTTIVLSPLNKDQVEMSDKFDAAVTLPTTGVSHRALALMRDVLALPSFRTGSYTQIWIPGAVHGGVTSGALHSCPEVLLNPFLGGAIMDSRLLPPINARLPFHGGGRVLQFIQARSVVKGWITAALPLGGHDDVGNGYILSTAESFIMSLYERGHGAYGEGGARGGTLYSKRYASGSGLNSPNLDFLPVQNIEDVETVIGGVGAVPVEERHNDQLWRSYTNGTESHTAALDEFNVRQLLVKDAVEALERGTDKDTGVPHPSLGWLGSYLSLTYFSSNATTSSDLGCGAVEMQHPVGGLVYRALKSDVFRGVVEARAGASNFIRLLRVAFIAAHLEDIGESELQLPARRDKKADKESSSATQPTDRAQGINTPPFVVCVNEVLKKKGLSHNLFTRALQNLSGPLREHLLIGSLVDVERHAEDPRTHRPFVEPEAFPNSYVRGSSMLYCRVGVNVEMAKEGGTQAQSSALLSKGVQMQAYAEPIIPEGGIAYGGPVSMRVVENEGQFREYVKDLDANGSRRDWGAVFLHAKPVTTTKAQTAASGAIEAGTPKEKGKPEKWTQAHAPSLEVSIPTMGFTEENFHVGGYQAIELIRFTNLTPLLWVRVDPSGVYGGRISIFQPDACLAECLYHDGDAAAQIDAMRALAERPLRIQPATKVTTVYDVNVAELPVRVIGDCLRGSATAHSSLPHTPALRAHAALAIAQWQNNKGPKSKDDIAADNWVGLSLLFQYFRERFCSNGVVMPAKFSRLSSKKSQIEAQVAANTADGGAAIAKNDDGYQYLDLAVHEDGGSGLDDSEDIEIEEDEEYRVRAQVVTAIASIRAGDGLTPLPVLRFLETILQSDNGEVTGHLIYPDEQLIAEQTLAVGRGGDVSRKGESSDEASEQRGPSLAYLTSMLVADHLLALCHINASPSIIIDPATGKPIQASDAHPVTNLMQATRSWLDWEIYRQKMRDEVTAISATGISGNCQSLTAANAIIALASLAILRQSTSDAHSGDDTGTILTDTATPGFYINIFDQRIGTNDLTRAAAAQAVASLYCAGDRLTTEPSTAVGLLTALEFLLERIEDKSASPSLRETLALIMMDASTGKVCSTQRVGVVGGRNDLVASSTRLMTGPLGASHGGDNGSSLLTTVSPILFPAASAVNDGARRGLRLLMRAGHPKETLSQSLIIRVARFATRLWRMINGEPADTIHDRAQKFPVGVCAYNGALRCSLLALWQWIWPKGCVAVLAVQAWGPQYDKNRRVELGIHHVMQCTDEEKAEGEKEESIYAPINQIVAMELDRQLWRGEMARKAYDMYTAIKVSTQHIAKAEQGVGQPLPPIERDASFKQGGWIASAAQQRRKLALDGGTAVTKLRLNVKNSSEA